MDVFIGNLPGEATLLELEAFLGGLKLHTDVQHRSGRDISERDYHFFVVNDVNRLDGLALINQFNGRAFHGRIVEAREYYPRRSNTGWDGAERRVNGHEVTVPTQTYYHHAS